jgi:hypothetical protein
MTINKNIIQYLLIVKDYAINAFTENIDKSRNQNAKQHNEQKTWLYGSTHKPYIQWFIIPEILIRQLRICFL